MRVVRSIFATGFLFFIVLLFQSTAWSQTATPTPTPQESSKSGKNLEEIQNKISEYEKKVGELKAQGETLASQIKIVDSQVALTELRINETQAKIDNLQEDIEVTKDKIQNLEGDINGISKALLNRAIAAYQFGSVDTWQVLLTSESIDNFFTRLKYLRMVQLYDQRNILSTEQAKISYANQQDILVEKQKEAERLSEQLDSYNEQLETEKSAKESLLRETRGSEAVYQDLLAEARAEYAAIQGIIAGRGTETEVGKVNEGDRIASIIQGASCNSGGTHLHFIVKSGGSSQNPFNYLGSIDYSNNSGGDPFNPSGSWRWPIDPRIQYNQGYGETWAVRNTWVGGVYRFHDGIDIGTTGSQSVRAVKSGTLYQGSYSGMGGCRLRYVKVSHDEGGVETFYLHINY